MLEKLKQYIQQINELLGFTGREINNINNNLGNITFDLLYETNVSTFNPQTITLMNGNDYDLFAIHCSLSTVLIMPNNSNAYLTGFGYPTGGVWQYHRSVTISNGKATFDHCYVMDYRNQVSTDNTKMIPWKIYGLKILNGGGITKEVFILCYSDWMVIIC